MKFFMAKIPVYPPREAVKPPPPPAPPRGNK